MPQQRRESAEQSKLEAELTPEACELLEDHEDVETFKDGMRKSFLDQIAAQNISATADELNDYFDGLWLKDRQRYIKVIINEGGLANWREIAKQAILKMESDREQADDFEEEYFDGDAMRAPLIKLLSIPEKEREKSGIDYNMLFYFLEGTGDVKVTWPVKVYSGQVVTREQYVAEAKKMVKYVSELEQPKSAERKAEAKDWREVKRDVEVDAVGDLHGGWQNFVGNLKRLGAARETPAGVMEWTGGNRKVVLLGDILGDRNTQGLAILDAISELKKQAKAAGGQLDELAGNHDDFVLSYLMKRNIAGGGNPVANCGFNEQGIGLLELADYASDELKNYDWDKFVHYHTKPDPKDPNNPEKEVAVYDKSWDLFNRDQDLIIQNMRRSPEGRKRLEQMCEMKIAEVYDDTLFIHTDVSETMARLLLEGKLAVPGNMKATVENINKYFQENLRKALIEGAEPDKNFDKLRQIFLFTDNRDNFTDALVSYRRDRNAYDRILEKSKKEFVPPDQIAQYKESAEKSRLQYERVKDFTERTIGMFKKAGINAIVHGHSRASFNEEFEGDEFPIISADMPGHGVDNVRSVVRVNRSGVLERGIDSNISNSLTQSQEKRANKEMIELRTR